LNSNILFKKEKNEVRPEGEFDWAEIGIKESLRREGINIDENKENIQDFH